MTKTDLFLYKIPIKAFAYNCGCAINPARDFGPRIFTAMVYGKQGLKNLFKLKFIYHHVSVFTGGNYFFWVPIVGPLTAGALGAALYKVVDFMRPPSARQTDIPLTE